MTRASRSGVPRRGKRETLSLRGTALKTTGRQSDLSRSLNSFMIAPGSNPLDKMSRIQDLGAEMCTAGLTLTDRMLYTIFINALPAEYEVEARNLESRDSIGRDDIIKAVRERRWQPRPSHHRNHSCFSDSSLLSAASTFYFSSASTFPLATAAATFFRGQHRHHRRRRT